MGLCYEKEWCYKLDSLGLIIVFMASIILVGCYDRDMSSDNKNLETIEHTLGMKVGEKIFKLITKVESK